MLKILFKSESNLSLKYERIWFPEKKHAIPCYSFNMCSQFCSLPVRSMFNNWRRIQRKFLLFSFHFFFLLLVIIIGSFLELFLTSTFYKERQAVFWLAPKLLFISNAQVKCYLCSFACHFFRIASSSSRGKKKYIIFGTKVNYVGFGFKWKKFTAATTSKACSEIHPLSQIHG